MLAALSQCMVAGSKALRERHGEVVAAQPPQRTQGGGYLANIEAMRSWHMLVEGELAFIGALRSEAEELARDEVWVLTMATACGCTLAGVEDVEEMLDTHASSVQALFTAYTLLRENGRAAETTLQHSIDDKQIQLLVLEVAVITLNALIALVTVAPTAFGMNLQSGYNADANFFATFVISNTLAGVLLGVVLVILLYRTG
jgi:hypothetical protein